MRARGDRGEKTLQCTMQGCYGTGLGEGNIYDLTHTTGVGSYHSQLECPGRINYIIIVQMAHMRMLRERGSRVNACPRGSAYYATCHLPFVSSGEQRDHGGLITWYVALITYLVDVLRCTAKCAEGCGTRMLICK